MNQRRIAIVIVAGGLVLLALLLFSKKKLAEKPLAQTGADRPRLAPSGSGSSVASPSAVADVPSTLVGIESALRTPISFYGKVVDQSGAPVPDADVRAEANDRAAGASTTKALKTDANGRFEIQGMHGIQLAVSVSKVGYFKLNNIAGGMRSGGGFRYYSMGGERVHIPDRQKPVVFTLFKRGRVEKLERLESQRTGLPDRGQAVMLDVTPDGEKVDRQIVIRAWSTREIALNSQPYDWRAEIQPDHGQICARQSDFDFDAPETGYQAMVNIDMPASVPAAQWQDVVKKGFFVRFDDGVFARIEVNLAAPPNGSVSITGFLNPKTGSRNLEKDPSVR